jgi:hypothetical protein
MVYGGTGHLSADDSGCAGAVCLVADAQEIGRRLHLAPAAPVTRGFSGPSHVRRLRLDRLLEDMFGMSLFSRLRMKSKTACSGFYKSKGGGRRGYFIIFQKKAEGDFDARLVSVNAFYRKNGKGKKGEK